MDHKKALEDQGFIVLKRKKDVSHDVEQLNLKVKALSRSAGLQLQAGRQMVEAIRNLNTCIDALSARVLKLEEQNETSEYSTGGFCTTCCSNNCKCE